MNVIRFSPEDVALFSMVSHDTNPLHVSADYARRTPFGAPVVFGILSTLAIIGRLPLCRNHTVARAVIDFRGPLFVNCDYRASIDEPSPDVIIGKLYEGSRLMLSATLTFRDGYSSAEWTALPIATRAEPAKLTIDELTPGMSVAGVYSPPAAALSKLIERWELHDRGISTQQLVELLWTSYLVGMEVPGERAAYSRLDINFENADETGSTPLRYTATVVKMDQRFGLLTTTGELWGHKLRLASVQIMALVRSDSPVRSLEALLALLPQSGRLRGKTALVTGGSRGLGAVIVHALALQGATVYLNYQQSHSAAQSVLSNLPSDCGPVVLAQGDASGGTWCRGLNQTITERCGGLDILVCNATPAIRPMDLAPETLDRLLDFTQQSLGLVAAPLAQFLPVIARRCGQVVVISSEYARTTPGELPQYVAAKCAVEGLVRAVSSRYETVRFLVPRPSKLLTDTNNTPVGRVGAMEPEHVAAAIVNRLCTLQRSDRVEIMEEF